MTQDEVRRWLEDDANFRDRLEESKRWEHRVAEAIRARGIDVVETEIVEGNCGVKGIVHRDDGDLLVGPHRWPVEVKARATVFTSALDWPVAEVIVGNVSRWRDYKPMVLLIISRATGAIVALPVKNRSEWIIRGVYQPDRRFVQLAYIAPARHLVDFEVIMDRMEAAIGRMS